MKKFLPILLSLLVSCGAAFGPKSSEVTVSFFDAETDKTQTCTGTVVGLTRILTAEHCVSQQYAVYVEDHSARVLKVKEDLALLEVSEPLTDFAVMKIADKMAEQGEAVSSWGFAYAGPLMRFTRSVAGYVDGWMILDGPLAPGMSGGAVVNSKGEMVGVNQSANPVVGLACNAEEIRQFLK